MIKHPGVTEDERGEQVLGLEVLASRNVGSWSEGEQWQIPEGYAAIQEYTPARQVQA